MTLSHLKSGTDIRGSAVGEDMQLSDAVIERIALGFLQHLRNKTGVEFDGMKIYIGHDSRISADRIKSALIRVFGAYGVKTFDCGLSSTPAMFMVTVETDCTASVQITASHHPYDKNGLKFFTREGGFEGEDISAILKLAEQAETVETAAAAAEKYDFMPRYAEILREKIKAGINADSFDRPLEGFHIVTDAGNGAGGFFATDVLEPLGADISGSEFLEPDGMFLNHIPNPENPVAMSFISKSVLKNNADFGVIFDTDVDRAACVDKNGDEINRNSLVALASVIALEGNIGGTIVTDSVTSDGLKEFIEEHLGGKHYRFKRGYKNVINKAIELNGQGVNCPLAIETSGHAALRENYFLDDGAYLMTKIVILLANLKKEGKSLEDLLSALKKPAQAKEIRYSIKEADFRTYGENIIASLAAHTAKFDYITPADDNREGFRFSFDASHGNGWALLRLSVHDPVLPLNIESNSPGGVKLMEAFIEDFIKNYNVERM